MKEREEISRRLQEALRKKDQEKIAEIKQQEEEKKKQVALNDIYSPEGLLRRKTPKSKEEILANGSAREKVLLFIADGDALSRTPILTGEEYETLYKFLCTLIGRDEDERKAMNIIRATQALLNIEAAFTSLFYEYQRESNNLARLLNEWNGIEEGERLLMEAYKQLQKLPKVPANVIEAFPNIVLRIGKGITCVGDRGDFHLNEARKEKLSDLILRAHFKTEGTLKEAKGYVTAMDELLALIGEDRGLLPFREWLVIEDYETEKHLNFIEVEEEYRESYLRKKTERGEAPTQEEADNVIFPDYIAVKKDERVYEAVKEKLNIELEK